LGEDPPGFCEVGASIINRRFVTIAVWCREIAIPAAALAALVTASSPADDVYSLAVANVTPVTKDLSSVAASVQLSGDVVTTSISPPTAPEADAQNIDEPEMEAAPVNEAVLAALEAPDENLLKPSLDGTPQSNNVPKPEDLHDAIGPTEIVDECLIIDVCVDRYLWQLYERTPKEDAIKESTQRKVTIKKKGKLITVTRTSTTVVDEDFGWKDPKAAKNVGMSLQDYVIGGVDRDFRLKLFQMLKAADQAGLAPGITSAFRDDYRQSIASGLKAANNRSYHGGSLRGGYGHGLAADVVSTRGATRRERQGYSEILWKWIDTHGSEFGIGRPYLDRDPPHVAPIEGEEFARHRPGVKVRQATAQLN
jgi:hypothetical protein